MADSKTTSAREQYDELHRSALRRLRLAMGLGLGAHLLAAILLDQPAGLVDSSASLAARAVHRVTAWTLGLWYLAVPALVVLYAAVERWLAPRLSVFALIEFGRLSIVVWLGLALTYVYASHRLCNCLEYLSETSLTVAALPSIGLVLFGLSLATGPARRARIDCDSPTPR